MQVELTPTDIALILDLLTGRKDYPSISLGLRLVSVLKQNEIV